MPSPFPGMDPYIEGQLWEDFHVAFYTEVRSALVPQLQPRYVAVIERRVYLEHTPDPETLVIIPDVTVAKERYSLARPESAGVAVLTEPVRVPLRMPERIREAYLEICLRATHEVVTVIEVLSPGNKRVGSDGQREYLAKREAVLLSSVHLVELDLLRGGERVPMAAPTPPADYYALVSREQRRPTADVWPIQLRSPLPGIPIPLAGSDPDVALDLQAVFDRAYDRSGYQYSLSYRHGTVPPLRDEDAAWAAEILASRAGPQP
jgi:hypothetical protein